MMQHKKTDANKKARTLAMENKEALDFPSAFEQLPIGVAYVNLQGHWLHVNQKACEITGYTHEELQGITFQDITHPYDLQQDLALVQQLLSGQATTYALEKRYIRKDNTSTWVNISVFLVRDAKQEPSHFVVTIEDINQRKQIEEKYQIVLASEIAARIEAEHANEQLKILQAITDTTLTHLTLDELFHAIFSRIRHIMAADNIAVLLLNEENQMLAVRAVLGIEEAIAPEIRIPLGKGFAGRVAMQRQPLVTNDINAIEIINPVLRKEIHSLLGVPLMVNERVLGVVHVGMKRLYTFTDEDVRLFQRVADRMALAIERALLYENARKAHQQVLEHAQLVERLYYQQRDFISVVSHEFRTTLTGIQGFSDILRSTALCYETVQEYATDIYTDALRLLRMINNLLDVEQMRAGKMSFQWGPVDLHDILQQQIERMRPTTQKHSFRLIMGEHVPLIEGDADKLSQVVGNLLSNAVKYSPHGGEILLDCQIEGQSTHLRIRDHGIGIPQEALEKIFTSYNRIYSAKTHYIQGTGLGLSIVQQIVLLHNGKVWAESSPEQGTTFHVLLPIRQPTAHKEIAL